MNPITRFFREDIPAVFSSGKWRIKLAENKYHQLQLEKQKPQLFLNLGDKSWKNKIKDNNYHDLFIQLEDYERLIDNKRNEINVLEEKYKNTDELLISSNIIFDKKLNTIREPQKIILNELAQIEKEIKAIDQQKFLTNKTTNKLSSEIKSLNNSADQLQKSNLADKAIKIQAINNSITHLQDKVADLDNQLKLFESNLQEKNKLLLLKKESANKYNMQISDIQSQKTVEQKPILDQLQVFKQALTKYSDEINLIQKKIEERMPELGSLVYEHKPNSEIIRTEIADIDKLNNQINNTLVEKELLQARLSSVNSKSIQRVIIMFASLSIICVLFFVFLPKPYGPVTPNGSEANDGQQTRPFGVNQLINEQANKEIIDKKKVINPPYDGFFMVTEDLSTEEIKPVYFKISNAHVAASFYYQNIHIDKNLYDNLLSFDTDLPVVLFRSSNNKFDGYQLFKGRPSFGIYLEENSSPCTIEYISNTLFSEGDEIFSIDNEKIENCDDVNLIMETKQPFTQISIEFQRGTNRNKKSITPPGIVFPKVVSISNQYMDNSYLAIYPHFNLSSGVYCFIENENNPEIGYCFRIK